MLLVLNPIILLSFFKSVVSACFVLRNELYPVDKGMTQEYKVPRHMEQGVSSSVWPTSLNSFQCNSNQFHSIPYNLSKPNPSQIQFDLIQPKQIREFYRTTCLFNEALIKTLKSMSTFLNGISHISISRKKCWPQHCHRNTFFKKALKLYIDYSTYARKFNIFYLNFKKSKVKQKNWLFEAPV